MNLSEVTQSEQSLTQIRSGFVAQGTSLHGWCKVNGIDTTNARRAIAGTWKGKKASALVEKIIQASNGGCK